uniref:DUF255 domain-containing protein n=1 Tax=Globodera rostochiensis TaxID=31243 RepID=A0A914HXW8_GLORO
MFMFNDPFSYDFMFIFSKIERLYKRGSRICVTNSYSTMSSSTKPFTNKLAAEKSPYLLQHSTNPVDWFPWGDEAFKKAKEMNRPIFLSVGYSTCHWCHVMEHESFEDKSIGRLLNENFVSIKVDREERPDVDKLYMSFIQSLTGGGGWPMSVFLTPDLEPITGGTYFPPQDSMGRLGFSTILHMISDKWRNNQQQVKEQGRELAEAIRESVQHAKSSQLPMADTAVEECYARLSRQFDKENGGFGSAPKFPKAVDLDFLLYFSIVKKPSEEATMALKMLRVTFEKLFAGGIHDHVGKGFHRYSVDSVWHVPHFEKMLYDQGQLLRSYANFYKVTGEAVAAEAVCDIADYIALNLTHPLGGLFCAEDADSLPTAESAKKREGAFCVWSFGEVERVLGDRPSRHNENVCLNELVCSVFNVKQEGNVPGLADPHGALRGQNVLHRVDECEISKIAAENKMTVEQLKRCIEDAKRFLAEERAKRPRPHLDDKILTAWNALAISGFCAAAQAIPYRAADFKERAEKAVAFIRCHLMFEGELLRSAYVDNVGQIVQIKDPIKAFADDYAFLIEALLSLYSLNFDESLIEWAQQLQLKMDELFWDDSSNSGYFMSRAGDPSIIVRMQDEQDGAEPCTNSVAASNLICLGFLLDSADFRQRANDCFAGATQRIERYPYIMPRMLIALHSAAHPPFQIIVVGQSTDEMTQKMLKAIHSKFLPMGTLIFIDKDRSDQWLYRHNSHLADYACVYTPGQPSVNCKSVWRNYEENTSDGHHFLNYEDFCHSVRLTMRAHSTAVVLLPFLLSLGWMLLLLISERTFNDKMSRFPFLLLIFSTLYCFTRFPPCLAAQTSGPSKQQRSRQIHAQSQILSNLFTNYDPNQRPPVRELANHPSIIVTTSLVLNRVIWHTHSAEVDLNLHQDWEDSRLAFDVDPREDVHEVLLPTNVVVWRPNTFFVGAQEQAPSMGTRAVQVGRSVIEQSGFMRSDERRTLRVNFQSDGAFPVRDKRNIRLAISSASYPIEDVVYLWANSPPLIQPIQVADNLYEGSDAQYVFEEAEAGDCPILGNLTANSFSCIELIVRFRADVGRGFLSSLVPGSLLVLISWFHFWVHSSWSVPRTLSAAIPLLVFVCVLLLLPIESCALRIWFLLCTVFTLLSLVEYFLVIRHYTTVTTGPLSPLEQQNNQHPDNERKASPTTTTTVVVTQDEPLIQHGETATMAGHAGWHSNKLDVVSRVAFPIAFLLATCIYVLFHLYL